MNSNREVRTVSMKLSAGASLLYSSPSQASSSFSQPSSSSSQASSSSSQASSSSSQASSSSSHASSSFSQASSGFSQARTSSSQARTRAILSKLSLRLLSSITIHALKESLNEKDKMIQTAENFRKAFTILLVKQFDYMHNVPISYQQK